MDILGLVQKYKECDGMNGKIYTINEIKQIITPIVEKYGVDAIYLFGSYAKGYATEQSDIDFRIDKGDVRGIQFAGLNLEMEEVFKKSVDLVTTASLDEEFRNNISREEVLLYERER